jgi:hypothetical protein
MGHGLSLKATRDVVEYWLQKVFGVMVARRIELSDVYYPLRVQLAEGQNMPFPTSHVRLAKDRQGYGKLPYLKGRERRTTHLFARWTRKLKGDPRWSLPLGWPGCSHFADNRDICVRLLDGDISSARIDLRPSGGTRYY